MTVAAWVHRGWRAAGLAALTLALAGCATVTTPTTRYYVLEAGVPAATPVAAAERDTLVVKPVEMASFLAQNGIVVADGNAVEAASYHRWAEPLGAGLQRFVTETLRATLPQLAVTTRSNGPDGGRRYAVRVGITAFHGTLAGAALVAGSYVVEDADGNNLLERTFDATRTLDGSGYDALVTELATGLAEACARIGADIETVIATAR